MEPQRLQIELQEAPKTHPKIDQKNDQNLMRFWIDFGSVLAPKRHPKSVILGVHFRSFFGRRAKSAPRAPKRRQEPPKRLPESHFGSENWPFWCARGSQEAPKGSQESPSGPQEATAEREKESEMKKESERKKRERNERTGAKRENESGTREQ